MIKLRKSNAIAEAEALIAALRPMESKLDFGKGLTLAAYIAKTNATRALLADLNTLIAQLEAARNAFTEGEDELIGMSRRMRNGVLVQFGPDSDEFGVVGGIRTSQRKRAARRPGRSGPVPPTASSGAIA